MNGLVQIGQDIFSPLIEGALEDPGTQEAIDQVVAQSLQSPVVKKAVRGLMIEAALWVAGGLAVGVILLRATEER